MFGPQQEQKVAEGATAIQTGGSLTINNGVSSENLRAMTLDIVRAELWQFMGVAGEIATKRAEKVIEDLLLRLRDEYPDGINQAKDPDFLYMILAAQRVHARGGDDDIEAVLVEILVERSKDAERTLKNVVLSQCVEVLSKITHQQIAALSLVFLLTKTARSGLKNIEEFYAYADAFLLPLVEILPAGPADFMHLQYAGCGAASNKKNHLWDIWRENYPGMFEKSFDMTPDMRELFSGNAAKILKPCWYFPGKFRISVRHGYNIMMECATLKLDANKTERIQILNQKSRYQWEELASVLTKDRYYLSHLFEFWKMSGGDNFVLTSVGLAIAHANLRKNNNALEDLSKWIY